LPYVLGAPDILLLTFVTLFARFLNLSSDGVSFVRTFRTRG
jgi:hypothetical protein